MKRKWKILSIISGAALCLFIIAGLALTRYANVIAGAGVEKALGRNFSTLWVGEWDLKVLFL